MSIDAPPAVEVEPVPQSAAAGEGALPPAKPPAKSGESDSPRGWFGWWQSIPLYLRILAGVAFGVLMGVLLRSLDPVALRFDPDLALALRPIEWAKALAIPSQLVLRLLGALAAPLILLAVVQALMHANFPRGSGPRLLSLLVLNTLVAIFIGLTVANIVRPGKWTDQGRLVQEAKTETKEGIFQQFLDNIPKSVLGPLGDGGKVISVILLAIAFGIALRRLKAVKIDSVSDLVDVGFRTLIIMLHWIIEVIPLAELNGFLWLHTLQDFSLFHLLLAKRFSWVPMKFPHVFSRCVPVSVSILLPSASRATPTSFTQLPTPC